MENTVNEKEEYQQLLYLPYYLYTRINIYLLFTFRII